ncbi:S1 family peptidase [Tessaracoccus sp. OS52]|uniref:S1 family peptidase n=1 Tax=Tessaracoccus sp. OS52 TaxID=2886691 RepID=UPI001D122F41|nr:S1 family peptidase [Tessaracoccus sp. OS52]MCC2592083.1 S1 family peptidase [Tessaracoccus sp. OS52]
MPTTDWAELQAQLVAGYDDARRELMQVPGVRDVGIGLRRRRGSLVEEPVYIAYVTQKLPDEDLAPSERVPPEVLGFATDVQVVRTPKLLLGFGDDEHDRNYGTKVGGIAINAEGSGGWGTLGCFCKRTSDDSVVLLSNHHVLLAPSAQIGSGVGQPEHRKSCCCTCNEMGKVLAADQAQDCAIASVTVPFFPKIRRIKRGDGTVEEEGSIAGTSAPVLGMVVWKVGYRTGLTRGTISTVVPALTIDVDPAFAKFAFYGDSGSVVVEKATGNVVGLLYAIEDELGTIGVMKNILTVQTTLGITVIPSDPSTTYTESWDEDDEDLFPLPAASPFESLVGRLRAEPAGRELLEVVDRNVAEALRLVERRRGFTVAWHRNRGPTWLAAFGRSARDPIYEIPAEIEGVVRTEALERIREALAAEGSDALREDLAAHGPRLFDVLAHARTVDEMVSLLEARVAVP